MAAKFHESKIHKSNCYGYRTYVIYVCIYLYVFFKLVGLIQITSIPVVDYNFNLNAPT